MWETKKSKIVYENPFFQVSEDQILRDNGTEGEYYVVNLPEAVFIIAQQDDKICLIKQFSYPNKSISWELPAGAIDPGETLIKSAKRELKEETGYEAKKWDYLGHIFLTPRLTNNRCHIFKASDLTKFEADVQEEESILDCKMMSMDEVSFLIQKGELADGPTLAVLFKAFESLHFPSEKI